MILIWNLSVLMNTFMQCCLFLKLFIACRDRLTISISIDIHTLFLLIFDKTGDKKNRTGHPCIKEMCIKMKTINHHKECVK